MAKNTGSSSIVERCTCGAATAPCAPVTRSSSTSWSQLPGGGAAVVSRTTSESEAGKRLRSQSLVTRTATAGAGVRRRQLVEATQSFRIAVNRACSRRQRRHQDVVRRVPQRDVTMSAARLVEARRSPPADQPFARRAQRADCSLTVGVVNEGTRPSGAPPRRRRAVDRDRKRRVRKGRGRIRWKIRRRARPSEVPPAARCESRAASGSTARGESDHGSENTMDLVGVLELVDPFRTGLQNRRSADWSTPPASTAERGDEQV
jgi:hypothetical protein